MRRSVPWVAYHLARGEGDRERERERGREIGGLGFTWPGVKGWKRSRCFASRVSCGMMFPATYTK